MTKGSIKQGTIQTPIDFKPDMHVVIQVETTSGRTLVASGNGIAINPLNLISVCLSIAKGNFEQYLKGASALVEADPAQRPHAFQGIQGTMLPGEPCKVCKKDQTHAIHCDNEGKPFNEAIPASTDTVQ